LLLGRNSFPEIPSEEIRRELKRNGFPVGAALLVRMSRSTPRPAAARFIAPWQFEGYYNANML